ncbi:MAG TPA: bi-domain-containing oxidoreductase [Candidatus Brocadiaceae bacterium]|nr:Gfo/Idh/MocA family oxidoreductase [Candidatus Woesearchaeota archaeon]
MKQLIQSYKTGELGLFEVPPPVCGNTGVLINTIVSLVSAGTEKMIVDIAKKSLFGKARARPDLVKQVINKMKQEGIKNTLEKVFNKLDTPIPLGYSCAGTVVKVGESISGISLGDRIACGGAGYASHSEINYIPKNLFVKIPDSVDDLDASFVTVGAIALQGVRQAEPTMGEKIAVIGLGLIGQLTVQLLKANGCKVMGSDIDPNKLLLAKSLGADMVCTPDQFIEAAAEFSNGYGLDKVIITASTSSNQPVIDAGETARHRAKVVVVGMVGMDVPRNQYYKKELDLRLSMAYGPGRYDPDYEEKGIDYPFAYVRWTEQRNFEAFLGLVAEGKVTPKSLITHQFNFNDALKAYDLIEGKSNEKYLGIILTYPGETRVSRKCIQISDKTIRSDNMRIGLLGAGNFTKAVILPHLKKLGGVELVGVCTATGISAHSTGKKYDFKYITTDADELIKNNDINVVFITTRHNTHAEYVIKALKAGKHVFTEKPLCIGESELSEIRDVYFSLRTQHLPLPLLMVGFNRRFSPLVARMKEVVRDAPMSITYRVNAGIIPKDSWIQDGGIGGGRIVGEVCHFIDTCSFLTGSEPLSVFASCIRKMDTSVPDEDNVSIVLTFANGSTATIQYFAYGNRQMPKEFIELFAGNTAMQMTDFRELVIFSGNCKEKVKRFNQDKGFKTEFSSFREGINSGTPPISFESLYTTTKATFAILESLRTGAEVLI